MVAHQIHEDGRPQVLAAKPSLAAHDARQALRARPCPHRDQHDAVHGELFQQGGRDLGTSGGNDDAVERGGGRHAQRSITSLHVNSAKIKLLQEGPGRLVQLFEALHRIDGAAHGGQDRRLIAGTGADLQHAHAGRGLQHLGHEGHRGRLGYGLPVTDGQRTVLIGPRAQPLGHKKMPGDPRHGLKDAPVRYAPGGQLPDHAQTQASGIYRCTSCHHARFFLCVWRRKNKFCSPSQIRPKRGLFLENSPETCHTPLV